MQRLAPPSGWKVPTGHGEHSSAFSNAKVPGRQGMQGRAPYAPKVPFAHGTVQLSTVAAPKPRVVGVVAGQSVHDGIPNASA
eukprot:805341-Rhodomonas_salina.7